MWVEEDLMMEYASLAYRPFILEHWRVWWSCIHHFIPIPTYRWGNILRVYCLWNTETAPEVQKNGFGIMPALVVVCSLGLQVGKWTSNGQRLPLFFSSLSYHSSSSIPPSPSTFDLICCSFELKLMNHETYMYVVDVKLCYNCFSHSFQRNETLNAQSPDPSVL